MQTKQAILEQFKQLERDLHAECEKAWNSQRRHTLVKQGEMRRELSSACAQSGHYYRGVHEKCEFCGALRDNDTTARNLGVLTGASVNGLPVRESGLAEHQAAPSADGYALRLRAIKQAAYNFNKIPEPLSRVNAAPLADHALDCIGSISGMTVYQGTLAIAGEKGVVMIDPVTGASNLLA